MKKVNDIIQRANTIDQMKDILKTELIKANKEDNDEIKINKDDAEMIRKLLIDYKDLYCKQSISAIIDM